MHIMYRLLKWKQAPHIYDGFITIGVENIIFFSTYVGGCRRSSLHLHMGMVLLLFRTV